MASLVFSIILILVGVGGFLYAASAAKKQSTSYATEDPFHSARKMGIGFGRFGGAAMIIIGLIVGVSGLAYTQNVGESKVLVSFTGDLQGVDNTEGLAFKAPWVHTVDFDVRNQQAIYKGQGMGTSEEEQVNGPEITFQDKDKVSGNVDVAIRYSIDPGKVEEIYMEYPTQEALTARLIDQDMRSVVRNSFSTFTTAEVLEQRAELEASIRKGLESRWDGSGVIVDSVALQGIRYPQSTQDGFTTAQESATALKKAQADLKVREAEAAQKMVVAEADAKANRIVTESLSNEVLTQKYYDTLAKIGEGGNLVVVPEGSTPFVNAATGKTTVTPEAPTQ